MRVTRYSLLSSAFVLILLLFGCAVSEDEAEQAEIDIADSPIEVRVTATSLVEDYENNRVAANQKYNGKVLSVSGAVESISGGTEGNALYVALEAGDFSLDTVRCYFAPNRLDEVISLNKGDRVTLRGLGDEEKDRDPFSIDVIGCAILER